MTEPIKQEIINNIFENGDKLITGPILQTVLIDMIDDVNVKDQEILSKTGSWDDAATQIPNLATKVEVTNLSESIARDLENVVDVDLTGYATEQWVESQGYLKEHQDISNLATKTELTTAENNLQGNITSLSESVARDLANVSVPEGVATEAWVQSQDYASKSYVDNAVSSSSVDLTGYATETWVQNQGYLTEHQDISNLATKSELNSVSESVQTDITNLSESVASSAVWKKGEGQDSVVQVLSGDLEFDIPTATNLAAVATGRGTKAPGMYSHAEGYYTNASGIAGHAEGIYSRTYGHYSHAEGNYTVASNECEHAQGRYNHSSENQIFSIGTGNSLSDRRNAVSVLEVDNSGSYTSSFFVQNIGGYDGTNPLPGTNDLATVINGLSSGGGSSETLWKKGTGQDSIVQILSGNREANTPTATESGSIAIGYSTTASGWYSHAEGSQTEASGLWSHAEGSSTKASGRFSYAEGDHTIASGEYSRAEGKQTNASGDASHAEGSNTNALGRLSHAEGSNTKASGLASHVEGAYSTASGFASHADGIYAEASGDGSHAEGFHTIASNAYEHAQGMYNLTSSNQIFSIGAGEYANGSSTRRNAISVLAVPNADSKILTASFFIQNIGGYDGTNPTPGTNDLATVLNNTETWTFTLEDGSTVTKNVRIS